MNEPIKAIIVDDEDRARELLAGMLELYCPEVEVVASCPDVPHAVKAVRKFKPDLVFSDIEMPGHSGLEILDFFDEEEIGFSIIFTTAYNQYAIQAMKMAAVDYLLKPIDAMELQVSIERFRKRTRQERPDYRQMADNLRRPARAKLAIPTRNGFRFVEPAEIILLKADNSYTEVVLTTGEKLLASRILRNFEEALAAVPQFFRTHKSFIINTDYITEYVKSEGGYILLQGGHQASISPERVQEFMEKVISVNRR